MGHADAHRGWRLVEGRSGEWHGVAPAGRPAPHELVRGTLGTLREAIDEWEEAHERRHPSPRFYVVQRVTRRGDGAVQLVDAPGEARYHLPPARTIEVLVHDRQASDRELARCPDVNAATEIAAALNEREARRACTSTRRATS